ncbi:MAG: peptidylprolyl isomerase [Myxococcota bacterium]|nr:peptidylprolyl isomerase [Myxococcota bacterium]
MFGWLIVLLSCSDKSTDSFPVPKSQRVTIETSMGRFVVSLDWSRSPRTAENWMRYVTTGFYDGSDGLGATVFHRVIDDFVVQGGGYTEQGISKETFEPIVNESVTSGLSNLRGTIAMARTDDPDSATSQFYVNVVDNVFLDSDGVSPGYAVFGTIVEGMPILDEMASVSVDGNSTPDESIVIIETQIGN